MAYTEEQLFAKLEKADAAGDVEAAKVIADEIRRIKSVAEPTQEVAAPVKPETTMPRLATDRLRGGGLTPQERARAGSQAESLAAGATALPKGGFQLGANIGDVITGAPEGHGFGDAVNRELEKQARERRQRAEAAGRSGFDAHELAGMGATGLLKTGVAEGAGIVGKALQAAKTGGVYGAAMPVNQTDSYFTDKAEQIGFASFLGALGSSGYQVGKAGTGKAAEIYKAFFTKDGPKNISEAWLRKVAGKDAPKFINAIETMKQRFPGQKMTVADATAQQSRRLEAAGKADTYASHMGRTQDDLAKVGNLLDTQRRQTDIGMKNIIGKESMTKPQLEAAKAERSRQAAINYAKDAEKVIPFESNKTLVAQALEKARAKQADRLMSKGEALRDQGRFNTLSAQSKTLADNRVMPAGEVRVPPRYAPTAPTVVDAKLAAQDAGRIAAQRQTQIGAHETIEQSLLRSSIGADSKALRDFTMRPSFAKAMRRAKNLAAEKGHVFAANPEKGMTVGDLQIVKRAISDVIKQEERLVAAGKGGTLSDAENKAITQTVSSLNKFLKGKSSGYRIAEEEFIKASIPIGQANVANAQMAQLFPKLDKRSPTKFVGSIDDPKFYQKHTRGTKGSLEEVFPQTAKAKRGVEQALEDQAHAKTLSNISGSMLKEVDGNMTLSLPHILSRPVVITNAILKHVGKDVTPQVHAQLEAIFANPQRFANILRQSKQTPEKTMLMSAIEKIALAASTQEIAKEAGE